MKLLINRKGAIILLVGLLIVGCSFVSDEELVMIRQSRADLNAEKSHIGREENLWGKNSLKCKQDLENWEKDMDTCNQKEINLIKGMSNKQLEIYSKYEESIKNNILAKAELNLRELKGTLADQQKNELFNIFEITKSLEDRRKELIQKQVELTERKQKNVNDTVRLQERREAHNRYMNMRIIQLGGVPYPSPSNNMLNAVQQSLQQWQQSLQQQQQRMQMHSINSSLRDIASALRGY